MSTRARRSTSFNYATNHKQDRKTGNSSGQRFWVELLENRCLLSANALTDPASVFDLGAIYNSAGSSSLVGSIPQAKDLTVYGSAPPRQLTEQQPVANGSILPTSPFPLEQTFSLHSLPGATKVIYLDFDGFITRDTLWNNLAGLQNILTPAYDFDGDISTFSDDERLAIQEIWERVAEDFRPFQIDVTTQDPGIEALRKSGPNDHEFGQRVVIGGSENDWYKPEPGLVSGGVSYGSFNWDSDTPNFVFGGDYGDAAADIAEAASHETGHSLGLAHDGQIRFYNDVEDPDAPVLRRLYSQYYAGHGTGETSWAPIMGVGYGVSLTQWSKGEYYNATHDAAGLQTLEDDLEIITNRGGQNLNEVDYRFDDHTNFYIDANPIAIDPDSIGTATNIFEDEGIIEQNTDVDYFSFVVQGIGEIVTLNVTPFQTGANLDVLAKVLNSIGVVIATSNPLDAIGAGGQTLGVGADGGWLLANGQYTDDLYLAAGTYYVSVEGASRPTTFIDPAFHPGPFDATGDPPDPELPPDLSDWGYSNYGSLGYYSITGTRNRALVVGVDFDALGGVAPTNWNLYNSAESPVTLAGLKSEAGTNVPYQLSISTTASEIDSSTSSGIDSSDLPEHAIPLDELAGYISAQEGETLNFTWSHLTPNSVYQIYVFGHADEDATNVVTVVGGEWNGVTQTYNFTQDISAGGMVVNDAAPGSFELSTYSLLVVADEAGEIKITVTTEEGSQAAVAGLAISPTELGSISGQKWNDVDGDLIHDNSEGSLSNWIIYLDVNNDGQLNSTADTSLEVTSPDLPQAINNYTTIKSELDFPNAGSITDINVTIDVTHGYDADLNIYLISPNGTRVKLVADVGGEKDNFNSTVFDDAATNGIASGTAPFTGTFRPQQPLSTLNGENPDGIWQLEVSDDAANDTGVLNSWSISVTLAGSFLEPYQITDANGNYTFPDLRPGQYFVREHFTAAQIEAGWQQTFAPPPVTVRSDADVQDIDFGNWLPSTRHGSIQGQKFADNNGNGVKDGGESGLSDWIVYIDTNDNGVRDIASTPTVVAATGLPLVIHDFATITSPVTVSSLGTVYSITVSIDITHSFVQDLEAYLISPSGRQVELFTAVGGQFNDFDITLDDSATRAIADIAPSDHPFTGTWRPEGLLSDFNSDDVAGTWTLLVRDTTFGDEGVLNGWSLTISTGELFRATASDGGYLFSDLPEGQYQIREEQKPGWVQVPPAVTSIPAAVWDNGEWTISLNGTDNPNDPNGADSQRNVKNVNFANRSLQGLPGDYNGSGAVDAGDYVIWRRTLGTTVSPFSGADGNGDGIINQADYGVYLSNFGHFHDDHGNNAATATQLSSVPVTRGGALEGQGDTDWFSFSATAGTTYNLSTVLGSLSDSVLRLLDTNGTTELSFNDNAVGAESYIQWTAPATGIYFAEVSGAGSHIGTYTLSVSDVTDDHGNTAASATAIAVPSTTAATLEAALDVDWFKFNAVSGTAYSFETTLTSLADSVLRLINKDGTTELVYDDDGGAGYASRIDWIAPSSGIYFVEVSGYGTDFGTYSLTSAAAGAGSGSAFALSAVTPFAVLADASVLPSAILPSPVAASEVAAQNSFADVLFGAFNSMSPSAGASTTGSADARGVIAGESQNDAALMAWVQTLADGNVGSALQEDRPTGDIRGENSEQDVFGSVDSIFDELGTAANSGGCAV